jgi:CheY-like chemotaxis protein
LQQVVVNLVKNAAKYSPPDSTIGIHLGEEDDEVVLGVKDRGVGLPAEMLDKVFDLFVQSKDTLDRSEGGLGVGLTLVKAIVDLHGGTVTAASEGPGLGSEFCVRLPRVTSPQGALPFPPSLPTSNTVRFRITVVEDNADSRATLQSLLELDGHDVRVAVDGAEGIELISGWQPDVALIDIGLPNLSGFNVAEQLRGALQAAKPYLVAVTGYGFPADREKAFAAGFDAHLVKPLKLSELRHVLARVAAQRTNRSQP